MERGRGSIAEADSLEVEDPSEVVAMEVAILGDGDGPVGRQDADVVRIRDGPLSGKHRNRLKWVT